jgi:hypothetical protein
MFPQFLAPSILITHMDLQAQLAITAGKLQLPTTTELLPWLKKLIAQPDSAVIISIEKPLDQAGPHVGKAWLSAKERLKVRKALIAINDSRAKRSEPTTREIPSESQSN